jgi:hypothetical protein
VIVGSRANPDQSGVLLHEIGHHIGATKGINNHAETQSHFERLHDKLTPYEKQEGPQSVNGRHEFVAESFASYFQKGREATVARYDEQWVGALESQLRAGGLLNQGD